MIWWLIMAVYILDPICLQSSGHNLNAIKRYAALFYEMKNQEVFLLTSSFLQERLSGSIGENVLFDRFFAHYYPDFIPIEGAKKFLDQDGNMLDIDIKELATNDLTKFFEKYSPKESDTIFYPSVDYFSLLSIVNYIDKQEVIFFPSLVLRFIGVMEYDHYGVGISLESILNKLNNLVASKRLNLKISAESDLMAEYLSIHFDQEVVVTPTLVSHDALACSNSDVFTIVFPGAGRRDKGFDRIASILEVFEERLSEDSYQVIVQLLSPSELRYFSPHALKLVNNSKVTLLPCSLDPEDIVDIFKRADIVVAPYDKEVYRFRSSAIMAEAAIYGRPIIASDECGFSNQIKKYELGLLAKSDDEFVDGIEFFRKMRIEERIAYASNARKNFLRFTRLAYSSLFQ